MVDVLAILLVHNFLVMIQSSVHAIMALLTWQMILEEVQSADVRISFTDVRSIECFSLTILAICSVNNGGCPSNSTCTQLPGNDTVQCPCDHGFVNVANDTGRGAMCRRAYSVYRY